MNRHRHHTEPFSNSALVKPSVTTLSEEVLIADQRAGMSPSDMVEQKFRTLLQDAHASVGEAVTPSLGASQHEQASLLLSVASSWTQRRTPSRSNT